MDPDPCRLCLHPVDSRTGIWVYNEAIIPPLNPFDIIQQHFGVHIYKTDRNDIRSAVPAHQSEYVCAACWTITEQFHRLHAFVKDHQTALLEQQTVVESAAEKDDGLNTNEPVSITHLKVEVQFADGSHANDDYDDDDGAHDGSRDGDIASLDVVDTSTLSRPMTTKRPRQPDRKPPVKHSPADIELQDRHIRDYFQMHCDHCAERFAVLRDAIEHYRSAHQRRGYLKCCGKRFFNRTMMLDHLRQHSDPRAFLCTLCDRTYCSQAALDLHLATHDRQAERPFVCVVCGAAFLKQFQMRNHQRAKHFVSSGKAYGCDICGNW